MATPCAPVNFCSPPNWKVDFPDLVGPKGDKGDKGDRGDNGTDGLDAPTEMKILLHGWVQVSEVFTIDAGCFSPYRISAAFLKMKTGTMHITIAIDGTPIPGLDNVEVTTVRKSVIVPTDNVVVSGAVVTLTINSIDSGLAEDLAISLRTPPTVV